MLTEARYWPHAAVALVDYRLAVSDLEETSGKIVLDIND